MRHSILMLVLSIFTATNAYAAIYKGHIFYVEDCQSCHPSECEVATSRTKDAWQKRRAKGWQEPIYPIERVKNHGNILTARNMRTDPDI